MPSWNIHIAHVERLLREEGPARLGIRDESAFLFGNFVPDVYVGYMVAGTSRVTPYAQTHLTDAERIPLPDHELFWDRYVAPGMVDPDLVLGAWCHLACDHVYNAHVRAYIASIGVSASNRTRIRKQADFAAFGRSLDIGLRARPDDALVAACGRFPQYPIAASDVRLACEAAGRVVDENQDGPSGAEPDYCLLSAEFFSSARDEAHATCVEGLLRARDLVGR